MKKTLLTLSALALLTIAGPASAEQIELANGKVIQGEILGGRTTEDGLAGKLYGSGGELMIKWKHVLPERAKKLRIDLGIDLEEQDIVSIPGHELTLENGEKFSGLLLNPEATTGPHRLKTARGVREYPRDNVAGVAKADVDVLLVYTAREAYQMKLDELAPTAASGHFELGVYAFAVGDYDMAKKHWDECGTDEEFVSTDDGRSLAQRLKNVEILIAAKGAQAIVQAIKSAKSRNKWNEARDLMLKLKQDFTDERILKAVRADVLERSVVRGRDDFFIKRVQIQTYRVMKDLIRAKARERKKPSVGGDRNEAASGTLAAAKQWTSRELPTKLAEEVSTKLGLELDEMTAYWERRKMRQQQTATFGSGTFIVVKAELPKSKRNRRRAPGSDRNRNRGGGGSAKQVKPLTEEEWWDQVNDSEQVQWLTAYFVEGSDQFEVIRIDESEKCSSCGGMGYKTVAGEGGSTESQHCTQCNGAGKERRIMYR
jgi:hypothetical protein